MQKVVAEAETVKPTRVRRRFRWWFPLLTFVMGVGAIYFALESLALLHLVDYRNVFNTLSDEPWRNPLNRLDPELLHVHKPHQRITGVMESGDIAYYLKIQNTEPHPYDVQIDRDGFRNARDLDRADVAVIGDSYIEGVIVPQDEIISSQLERILHRPVINLGQIWYGPQQELAVFKRYALPRHPKVCVWCFFEGNDLSDMVRYVGVHSKWETFAPTLHSFRARSFTRNAAVRLLGVSGPSRDRPDGEMNYGMFGDKKLYFFHQGRELRRSEKDMLPRFSEILGTCWQLCQENGIALVVAFVPTSIRVHQELCTFPENSVCRTWVNVDFPEYLRERVAEISPEIPFVNLTEGLRTAAKRGEQTYFSDDSHWTAAGHRVAAEQLAEAIEPLLKAKP